MSNLLSVSEVCNLYSVTRKTLYNWRNAGKLEMIKKGGKSYIERSVIDSLATKSSIGSNTQNDSELHSVITQLLDRIAHLEGVITHLSDQLLQCNTPTKEKSKSVTQQNTQPNKSESSSRPYDAKRTQEKIEHCKSVFTQLDPQQQKTITKKDFAILANVSRGTVTKYWEQIIATK